MPIHRLPDCIRKEIPSRARTVRVRRCTTPRNAPHSPGLRSATRKVLTSFSTTMCGIFFSLRLRLGELSLRSRGEVALPSNKAPQTTKALAKVRKTHRTNVLQELGRTDILVCCLFMLSKSGRSGQTRTARPTVTVLNPCATISTSWLLQEPLSKVFRRLFHQNFSGLRLLRLHPQRQQHQRRGDHQEAAEEEWGADRNIRHKSRDQRSEYPA